jgi:hypothetical protein
MKSPLFSSAAGLCLGLLLSIPMLCAGPIPAGKPPAYPGWWFERDVIPRLSSATTANWPTDYPLADDYAVVNIGQLKAVAYGAAMQMNLRLAPTGAGTSVNQLISDWGQPASATRDDYIALNIGQLKSVAAPFYDRLGVGYPWLSSSTAPDDYAVVNLGQLKHVFGFQIAIAGDSDADGLLDTWEVTYFGSLAAQSGAGDAEAPLSDSLSNRAESLVGTNPNTVADESAEVAAALELTVYSP